MMTRRSLRTLTASVCVTACLFVAAGCSHKDGNTQAAAPSAVVGDTRMQQFESQHQQAAAADAQKRAEAAAKMAHP